jgi:hypothetical protein
MREKGNACKLFAGKPEGKRALGRLRVKWMDNIKIVLIEIGIGDMDWTGLAQDI